MKKIFMTLICLLLVSICASTAFASSDLDEIAANDSMPYDDEYDIFISVDYNDASNLEADEYNMTVDENEYAIPDWEIECQDRISEENEADIPSSDSRNDNENMVSECQIVSDSCKFSAETIVKALKSSSQDPFRALKDLFDDLPPIEAHEITWEERFLDSFDPYMR